MLDTNVASSQEHTEDVESEVEVGRERQLGRSRTCGTAGCWVPVETPVESASVKRGSGAAAYIEERGRLGLRADGKRGQKHACKMYEAMLSPGTHLLPDLEEEVTSTASCCEWLSTDSRWFKLEH